MEKTKLRSYSLEQVIDEMVGKKDNIQRQEFEWNLQSEIIGDLIKTTRLAHDLTQEQLGQKIGVQKAQISRLERQANNMTIGTLLRVFNALNMKVSIKIEKELIEL